ncbi:MAG: PIN domain-containing protein [Candidatus Promineifilaceae bacterium]|nr:PIN domain-containing protein [Candidatus Promineifilaceae bacterium]
MGWIDDYQEKSIGVDTAPLIYFIEGNNKYTPIVDPFFQALDEGEFMVVTSTITLLEVLVLPLRLGKTDLVAKYREIILDTNNLVIVDVIPDIAEGAARLRASYNLRTPDAIQIATTMFMGSTTLITNDKELRRVKDIQIVLLDDLK